MIRLPHVSLVVAAVACSSSRSPTLDASVDPGVDARITPSDAEPVDAELVDAEPDPPYRHTIAIDGTDDFAAAEQFPTTTAGFGARVTWDDDHVYVGYEGPDLDPTTDDAGTKWLFAYVDVDPGMETGATQSQTYNTQHAVFPAGFGAELYARWKCDETYSSIEAHDAGAWSSIASPLTAARAGQFLELAIPRSLLGGATEIGIVTWMINERALVESSWAGLYADNFTDGYAASLPITKYLRVDFAASRAPNDPLNAAP